MHSLRPWLIRLAGITGLTVLVLFLFFNFVGKTDVTWALPWKKPFRLAWPELPRFVVWKTTAPDGQEETLYQVPTRQLTKAEIAQMNDMPGRDQRGYGFAFGATKSSAPSHQLSPASDGQSPWP